MSVTTMSVTDRLLCAIAFRLALLVLMCLAARVLPASVPAHAAHQEGDIVRIEIASRH